MHSFFLLCISEFIEENFYMTKILCILSFLMIAKFSFAEDDEGWCDLNQISYKRIPAALEKCKKKDILIIGGDSMRWVASICNIDTIVVTNSLTLVCEYRGSARIERK